MPADWCEDRPLLIASLSGRALAAAAAAAGLRCRVIDLFADDDTRESAEACATAAARGFAFERRALLAAAARLDPRRRCGVVYGSGFEADPGALAALCRGRPLLGNTPRRLSALLDPYAVAARLDRLAIPHPPVRRRPPDDARGWLQKTSGGCGGAHVRRAAAAAATAGNNGAAAARRYYQRRVGGKSYSATLLSGARDTRLIGVCATFCAPAATQPFRYGGAVRPAAGELTTTLTTTLATAGSRLARAFGLRGLWNIDAVCRDDGRWQLIEINPRPGMSAELFEQPDLLRRHLCAILDRPDVADAIVPTRAYGHEVVYATRRRRIAVRCWPDWVADRPAPGSVIDAGRPLCTVYAGGDRAAAVRDALRARRRQLTEWL